MRKVEYGKWYECKEGQMPEDLFEERKKEYFYMCTPEVLVIGTDDEGFKNQVGFSLRYKPDLSKTKQKSEWRRENDWDWKGCLWLTKIEAWMAIPPYNKKKE